MIQERQSDPRSIWQCKSCQSSVPKITTKKKSENQQKEKNPSAEPFKRQDKLQNIKSTSSSREGSPSLTGWGSLMGKESESDKSKRKKEKKLQQIDMFGQVIFVFLIQIKSWRESAFCVADYPPIWSRIMGRAKKNSIGKRFGQCVFGRRVAIEEEKRGESVGDQRWEKINFYPSISDAFLFTALKDKTSRKKEEEKGKKSLKSKEKEEADAHKKVFSRHIFNLRDYNL